MKMLISDHSAFGAGGAMTSRLGGKVDSGILPFLSSENTILPQLTNTSILITNLKLRDRTFEVRSRNQSRRSPIY